VKRPSIEKPRHFLNGPNLECDRVPAWRVRRRFLFENALFADLPTPHKCVVGRSPDAAPPTDRRSHFAAPPNFLVVGIPACRARSSPASNRLRMLSFHHGDPSRQSVAESWLDVNRLGMGSAHRYRAFFLDRIVARSKSQSCRSGVIVLCHILAGRILSRRWRLQSLAQITWYSGPLRRLPWMRLEAERMIS
jgi:hypothetical protein